MERSLFQLFRLLVLIFCVNCVQLNYSLNGYRRTNTIIQKCLQKYGLPIDMCTCPEELDVSNRRRVLSCIEEDYDRIKTELQLYKWPVAVSNSVDLFFDEHGWLTELTEEETKTLNEISDEQKRSRTRLVRLCQHILIDLASLYTNIQQLNDNIDSNKKLEKYQPSERRNIFCNAITATRSQRKKIHDMLIQANGHFPNKVNIYNHAEWNECIDIFMNVSNIENRKNWVEYESEYT
ncbi:uncharacterized protein LOC135839164 [Planococcus citri]|uniref:uncharacterized protein LOC135839164 n=1 Tax=Planococcus citri TaxID=170843 RepID=UPI0031F8D7B1